MKFWNLTIYPLPNEIGHFETLCDVENWLWIWENYFTWCEKKNTLLKLSKEWELEKILYWNLVKSGNLKKETKVNAEVLLIKSSGIILIFLPAFYMIIWPMTHQRNSLKISILKIWQPVFFWGDKTDFGILPLKWCIFRHRKKLFSQILPSNSYCSH